MKKKVVAITILILISIFSLLLCKKGNGTLNTNKIKSDKTFAIMVEKEDGSGYEESNSEVWPSDMFLNKELTVCKDQNDEIVSDVFEYENGNIVIETNKKIYCYLYFDKSVYLGNYLVEGAVNGINTSLEGGLYRYQGEHGSVNNYVCFGTSNKDTCLGNTDAYMYRIIGVNEDNKVKVLKNEALNSKYQWASDTTVATSWSDSLAYSSVNGSAFLTNATYVPSGWSSKIATVTWKHGTNNVVNRTASALYDVENKWTNTVDAKIGLIYAHDYAYAYQSGGSTCVKNANDEHLNCFASWMHLYKCDPNAPYAAEWTMSRYGTYSGNNYVWTIQSVGHFSNITLASSYSMRPAFYLNSDVLLIGGSGTSTDPFIIN